MEAGGVPQQPPTRPAPRRRVAADDGGEVLGRLRVHGLSGLETRLAGVRLRVGDAAVELGQNGHQVGHGFGGDLAVAADDGGARVLELAHSRGGVDAHHGAKTLRGRLEGHAGQHRPAAGLRDHRIDRDRRLGEVEHRLDVQKVDAGGHERPRLLGEGGAQGVRLGVAHGLDHLAAGADVAGDPAPGELPVAEARGEAGAGLVQFHGACREPVGLEAYRRAAEGVGVHDVRAGGEEAAVDVLHFGRMGDVPLLRTFAGREATLHERASPRPPSRSRGRSAMRAKRSMGRV